MRTVGNKKRRDRIKTLARERCRSSRLKLDILQAGIARQLSSYLDVDDWLQIKEFINEELSEAFARCKADNKAFERLFYIPRIPRKVKRIKKSSLVNKIV